MPEKLRFADNTEFNLAPNGVLRETSDKKKSFKFISELDYLAVEAIVSSPDNFATIYTIGQDGNIQNTYAECVAFKGLGIEKDVMVSDTEKADVYTVTYSVDAVEKALASVQKEQAAQQTTNETIQLNADKTIAELTMLIASMISV